MFKNVDPKSMAENVFSLFDDRWTLITAGTAERCNTMTASWGGLGVLWNKNVATVYVRPQRYTMEFLEKSDSFTLSFLGEEFRDKLNYCGSKSGRDVDKMKECNFTVGTGKGGAPYIAEAELVLVCKKICRMEIKPENILDEAVPNNFYSKKDYHRVLIGEIAEALRRSE